MDLIREILASHESGISRDGLLAWARLRGNPQMTDEELEAALAALGDEVVDVQGFLYLRRFAPDSAREVAPPPPGPAWGAQPDAPPAPTPRWDAVPGPAADALPAWPPPDVEGSPPPDQPAWTPPDQLAGSRRTQVVAGVAVAILMVVALGVSLALRAEDPAPSPAVPTPTSGSVVSAGSLAVGNCLVVPTEDTFDEVRTLPCSEPHDGEIFFVGDHPDGTFPSDAAFETFVDEQCLPAFEAYTGSDYYAQEALDVGWFTPTSAAWDGGDREVVCHLMPADGLQTDRSWRGGNP